MCALTRIIPSVCVILLAAVSPTLSAQDLSTPEGVLRALVHANAQKDLATMSALMAHDADAIGYSIGGRKYVGWDEFAREMEQEFADVVRLEIPITDLRVWTRGDFAWFAMELDYTRYVETPDGLEATTLPLRETGVLERRGGQWIVVSWHESKRASILAPSVTARGVSEPDVSSEAARAPTLDLAGTWQIDEEDKSYTAILDRQGNGTYTHQGGSFQTIKLEARRLLGTWHQTGNDREGGFEVLFSEDGSEARGVWWYTRVGTRTKIPPRLHGGTYVWTRLEPSSTQTSRTSQ